MYYKISTVLGSDRRSEPNPNPIPNPNPNPNPSRSEPIIIHKIMSQYKMYKSDGDIKL